MNVLAGLLTLVLLQGSPSKPKPLEFKETILQNGLRLITHEDHSTPVADVQVWFHVGSKDEKPGKTGFAHLFEHLMFKGSAQLKPEEHSNIITNAGGENNAYTQDDVTVYWETVPVNYLEKVLWMESDRLASLDVSAANFQQEREVVKEERLTRVENAPYGDIFELLYDAAFDVHPYKHVTIGSMADLNAATIEDVRDFFKTYYVPNNATLVVSGDFKTAQVIEWVNKYFGPIPKGAKPIERPNVREPEHQKERRISRQKAVPLPAYIGGYYIPEDGHPDSYPLTIAAMILSQGESSRIYQSLVYDKQLAVQADASGDFREDPNLFFAILILNRGASMEDAEKALNAELTRIGEEPVLAAELEKAKNTIRSQFTFGRQSVHDKGEALAHAALLHQDVSAADKEYDLFMKVTEQDIMRVSKKYFRAENRTVLILNPVKGN